MSAEPLVSGPSVGTHTVKGLFYVYSCDVSVEDGVVETKFIHDNQIVTDSLTVPAGSITQIDFTLISEGYRFENIAPRSRNHIIGSFELDFGEKAPPSQLDAGFRVPPGLEMEIEGGQQAQMTVTNRYYHRHDYQYSLYVTVVPIAGGIALVSPDPTLIEEAYEPPRPDCEWRPRRL